MSSFEYVIYGQAPGISREEIDTAEDKDDLVYLINEYQLAYGPRWTFTYKRRRKY